MSRYAGHYSRGDSYQPSATYRPHHIDTERGTGRGHFNPPKNTPSPSQGPGQKYGQFGRYIPNTGEGHVQPDKKDPKIGQFILPTGSGDSTVTTPSTFTGERYGQFEILIETVTPDADNRPTTMKSNPPSTTKPNLPPTTTFTGERYGQFEILIETVTPEAYNRPTTIKSNSPSTTKPILPPTTKPNPPPTTKPNPPPTTNPSSSEQMTEQDMDEETDSDSSDEDTEFCKYCKLNFTTPKAYYMHTRGIQHTTLVVQAKSKAGDIHYQKENVDVSVLEVNIPAPHPEVKPKDDGRQFWEYLDNIMDGIQHNPHPEGRDLHPDDIGRSIPSAFDCDLCNVKCTGPETFKNHNDGRHHKKNIEAAKKGFTLKKKKSLISGIVVEMKDCPSKFSEMAKDNHAPMLGLEYVTEFRKTNLKAVPRYVCNLCETKCDGSSIMLHLIGLKHRLHFMQCKNPLMFEQLTKNNFKKKKSELNTKVEEFARDMEEKNGRGDVKIKIELENFLENEIEMKDSMIDSKALAEKLKELEEGKIDSIDYEHVFTTRSLEPTPKKPRLAKEVAADRRAAMAALGEKEPSDHERSPYDSPCGRHPLDYRRRTAHDFRTIYEDQFDPRRRADPMCERRMYDERKHLDSLMAWRHHLDDPYAEWRHVGDIVERRRCLDNLERDRLSDILERRKRLQDSDADYLRIKRLSERETAVSSSPSLSTDDEKRLQDILARRHALVMKTNPRTPGRRLHYNER